MTKVAQHRSPMASEQAFLSPASFDKVSLYARVGHSLRNRIQQGDWPPGAQLPTIPALAKEYGVALVTIRQALQQLSADKLIESTRGRGTFVREDVRPAAQSSSLRVAINDRLQIPETCTIHVLNRTFTKTLPAHFLPEGASPYPEYAIIEKVHSLAGEPYSYAKIMVPRQIYEKFPRGADEKVKILRLIIDQGRLKLRHSHTEIVLSYADDMMASLLQCSPLSALVRIRTSRVDTKGKVVLCLDAYYRGDKFIYEVNEEGIELELPPTTRTVRATRSRA